mmetsp:Transcript_28896/g.46667  ORF Transcript_28896/g.46667 Transcript_28896/m.46667 type:complete len:238 (+) Transcript_28896:128-841(+)
MESHPNMGKLSIIKILGHVLHSSLFVVEGPLAPGILQRIFRSVQFLRSNRQAHASKSFLSLLGRTRVACTVLHKVWPATLAVARVQQIVGRHLTGLGPRRSKEISDELNLQAFNLCGVLFKMAIINTQPQQAFGLHQEIVGAYKAPSRLCCTTAERPKGDFVAPFRHPSPLRRQHAQPGAVPAQLLQALQPEAPRARATFHAEVAQFGQGSVTIPRSVRAVVTKQGDFKKTFVAVLQ